MKHIVFVGDKPSSKNKSPVVPFVGTQSYKALLDWIWQMDIDITWVIMMNKDTVYLCDQVSIDDRFRNHTFVALGNEASTELNRLKIEHFKLPHPSPKNRVLNDKKFEAEKLRECKNYLWAKGWNV